MKKIFLLLIALAYSSLYAQKVEYSTIIHDGIERSFYFYIPENLADDYSPAVVFYLHGGGKRDGGDAAKNIGLNKLAKIEKFAAVYPNGIDAQWNDGRGVSFRENIDNKNVDDVGFISELIDYFIENHNVDKNKIFISGASNGGMMTYRLACEITDKITAAATIISNMPENIYNNCKPGKTLPIMIVNGTDDPLVPYEGGEVTVLFKKYGKIVSVDKSVGFWVNNNNCSPKPEKYLIPNKNLRDDSYVEVSRYKGDADVIFYKIIGGGHTIPGMDIRQPKLLVGETNEDIILIEELWKFFSNYAEN